MEQPWAVKLDEVTVALKGPAAPSEAGALVKKLRRSKSLMNYLLMRACRSPQRLPSAGGIK